MLIQLLFIPLMALISLIITLIPNIPIVTDSMANLINFVRLGMWFTHAGVFATVCATFIFVESAMFTWNVIKFIYSKIPILNIR